MTKHQTKRPRKDELEDPHYGHILTRAIIDTIREPLIIIDRNLDIVTASRSFYKKFGSSHKQIYGKKIYDINNGIWNVLKLRRLLEYIIPKHTTIEEYEIESELKNIGKRTMVINAREVNYKDKRKKILLSILDVTDIRLLEIERNQLFAQKDILLKEMRHRIANSLQLIASILMIKVGMVESEETRLHLKETHQRIMSIATVQKQLNPSVLGGQIIVQQYLKSLCGSLAKSMIGNRKPITIIVKAGKESIDSEKAISLGLITTELVINSIKHAFPNNRPGKISVSYGSNKSLWYLKVEDNGIGKDDEKKNKGLGTSIIKALAEQMGAEIKTTSTKNGTRVFFINK